MTDKTQTDLTAAEAKVAALTAQVERMRYAIAVFVYQVDDTGEFTEAAMRGLKEALRAAITEETDE